MTPIAWIIRHREDRPGECPALFRTPEDAEKAAAVYLPGVAVVVPVVDGAEAAARIAKLETALRLFVGAQFPVSTAIDERGHSWSEAYLDEALLIVNAALKESK